MSCFMKRQHNAYRARELEYVTISRNKSDDSSTRSKATEESPLDKSLE